MQSSFQRFSHCLQMPQRMLRDTLSMQALASAAAVATSPGALPLLGASAWALASCDKPELLEAVELCIIYAFTRFELASHMGMDQYLLVPFLGG